MGKWNWLRKTVIFAVGGIVTNYLLPIIAPHVVGTSWAWLYAGIGGVVFSIFMWFTGIMGRRETRREKGL